MAEKLMTYLRIQCDKCTEYLICEGLESFLNFWRNNKELMECVPDGCDLAKACRKFKPKGIS